MVGVFRDVSMAQNPVLTVPFLPFTEAPWVRVEGLWTLLGETAKKQKKWPPPAKNSN